MTYTTVIFIILAATTGAWGLFCLVRRPGWLSIFLFASVLLICYFSTVELMGRPKPILYETANYKIEEVVYYHFDYERTIWIWVDVEGQREPISYSLPWNLETAESLESAFNRRGLGDRVVSEKNELKRLIDDTSDEDPVFHAEPQRSEEVKDYSEFE